MYSFQFAEGTEGFVLTVPTHELEAAFSARLDTTKTMASPLVLAATLELQSIFNNTFAEHRGLFEGCVPMLRSLVTQIVYCIIRNADRAAEKVDEPRARAHMLRFESLVQ